MKSRSKIYAGLAAIIVPAASVIMALGATPADAAVGGSGPYPADYETSASLANHTIFRPQTLPSERLPILVWGNGGCSANGLSQGNFLREIASYGFLAIANGAPYGSGSTNSQMLTQSIDWAVAENSRQGSKYYNRLDTTKIAVAGYSCGGLEAYAVSNDPRITTTGIFSSGLLNDADDYQLWRLTKPIAYFIGGPSDIAYPNAMDDWGKLPAGLPAFMGNLSVGHGGTYDQPNGGEFGRVAVLYLKWRLKGDITAGRNFVGVDCGLCHTEWTVQQKNLTLDGDTPPSTPPPSTPPPTTPPPGGTPTCTAAYSVQDQWNGGFVANVNVTAGTAALTGWRVTLTLPSGASVSSLWNGVASGTSGTITVANQSYNGQLAAGQTTSFGFQGTGNGSGATATCTGS
ncbi:MULTISPECIES: cellulose binding domain-containing protein [Micromonospora]|uniref:Cellulose-binding protein n=1 Tax=Micromonospora solifontis TaxID=2487138 RepID=A0ABX9WNL5_9ACTN|nr:MULTISPECIES: cellulose binding domain-containing protein [Micromonospora]NES14909.1 cellulose-binding protein [Micromonospora sp. PPF5-17B]NES35168.1 cellulose-binding protein [Micromonospora solifontis]NES55163.1 cellulose-binding protein [Micromonospora sp. PPF5-6]RNM01149.1 cellulose-binding protein [Micromonospora solifontis]